MRRRPRRDRVVTCRIDGRDLEAIDTLVDAGIRTTRSDAAAWLIHAGIAANRQLFHRLASTVGEIRRLRGEAVAVGARRGEHARTYLGVEPVRNEGTLSLPRGSLVVLCGPAAAGKSTFAGEVERANGLASTAVVSSDPCHLLLCDDTGSVAPAEWPVLQPNTFDLFVTIVGMRLAIGRPTVAGGVNLHMDLRPRLPEQARRHRCPNALIVFDVALEICLARNARRARRMPEEQLRAQRRALDEQLPLLANEGWDHVVRLDDQRRSARIQFVSGPS